MPATYGTQGFRDWTGVGGTFNLNHPSGATPQAVAVGIAQSVLTTDQITSVSWGGLPLARLSFATTATADEPGVVYMYHRGSAFNRSEGTVAVVSVAGTFTAWGITMSGNGDVSCVAVGSIHGTGANPSGTLATGATTPSGIAFGVIFSGVNAPTGLTPNSGYTALNASAAGPPPGRDFGTQSAAAAQGVESGENISLGWAMSSETRGLIVAFFKDPQVDATITGARAFATGTPKKGGIGMWTDWYGPAEAGGITNKFITGTRAIATAVGKTGTVRRDRNLTGTRAFATAVGKVGTTRFDRNLTGIRAFASAVGKTGTVTAQRNAQLTGVRAFATAVGKAGAARFDRQLSGIRAFATAVGKTGSVQSAGNAVITGTRAFATAIGKTGAVTVGGNVFITGARANATAVGKTGSTRFDTKITGTRAFATAVGKTGTPTVVRHVSITGIQGVRDSNTETRRDRIVDTLVRGSWWRHQHRWDTSVRDSCRQSRVGRYQRPRHRRRDTRDRDSDRQDEAGYRSRTSGPQGPV